MVYKYETHGLNILLDWVWDMLKHHAYRDGIIPAPECAFLLCPVDVNSETSEMANFLFYVLNVTWFWMAIVL